jgi:hypothetical protein
VEWSFMEFQRMAGALMAVAVRRPTLGLSWK